MDIPNLKDSPMFHLSLASKELFHSNFIGWLAEALPSFFCRIFPEAPANIANSLTADKNVAKVEREKKHYDLSIWLDNDSPCLILENKVKSIPDFSQLEMYESEDPDCECLILLTFCENFPDKEKIINSHWKMVTYRQLCLRMLDNIDSLQSAYHKQIISDYAESVIEMYRFLERDDAGEILQSPFLIRDCEEAKSLRIDDIRRKLWNSALTMAIKDALCSDLELKNKDFTIKNEFSRGTGIITIQGPIGEGDLHWGIQIQGRQYRHYMSRIPDQNSPLPANNLHLSHWFAENKSEIMLTIVSPFTDLFNKKVSQREDFCTFGTNFYYQYRNISEEANTQAVIETIIEDLKKVIIG